MILKDLKQVGTSSKSSVRTIYSARVYKDNDRINIELTGNGFLYNMVRIIAGTLIWVGMGKITPEEIPKILQARDRHAAGPTAPAKGLTMIGIQYQE